MQKRFLNFYPKISIFVEQTTKQDYVMTEEKERNERIKKYLAAKSDQELVALIAEEENNSTLHLSLYSSATCSALMSKLLV